MADKVEDYSSVQSSAIIGLLDRVIVQLNQTKNLVENDEDCSNVLIRLANARDDIKKAGKLLLRDQIGDCIGTLNESDNMSLVSLNKMLDVFMDE